MLVLEEGGSFVATGPGASRADVLLPASYLEPASANFLLIINRGSLAFTLGLESPTFQLS